MSLGVGVGCWVGVVVMMMGDSGVRSTAVGVSDVFVGVVRRRFGLGVGRRRGLGGCRVVDVVWFRWCYFVGGFW